MDNPQSMDARYDEDYFINGKKSGKSLYENYRWLEELTVPMCGTIADHCGMEMHDHILDFGCARGYSVKAFSLLGYDAIGYDVSQWALANCDEAVRGKVSAVWPPEKPVDWIVAKDVLEHISHDQVIQLVKQFFTIARKGVFVVVPLAGASRSRYVVPEYESDVTHCVRWPLNVWTDKFNIFLPHNWEVSARYRINGIKDNYSQFEKGNGFITCRKV